MMTDYQFIKDYRDNDILRHSFNSLARETFGLDFEDWYQNGYWGDNYNPRSIIVGNKVIANVSVNKTDMLLDGEIKHFLQLGTVMTAKEYRNKGLIRKIMKQIEVEYEDVDGTYLFANDSVLDFYPKFGFTKSTEYVYSKQVNQECEFKLEKIVMDHADKWKVLEAAMETNRFHGGMDLYGNKELIMFYVTKFMQEDVYYHKETDTYLIAEIEEGEAVLHNIFSSKLEEFDDVIPLLGNAVQKVVLGFAPKQNAGFECQELKEEDTTFFIKGKNMEVVSERKLRIPSLAHA